MPDKVTATTFATASALTPSIPARINMSKIERTLSAIAGSVLLYKITKKHKGDSLLLLAGGFLLYRATTGHCPVYSTVGELKRGRDHNGHSTNINVRTSMIVNRPREEVYAYWRELENLPRFMKHLESVDELSDYSSAWRVRVPGGLGHIRWEAEIVKEITGSELSWQSVRGASIENAGKINFSDSPGQGTRIDALISYRAPMGRFGEKVSRLLTPLFRDLVEQDILRFKQYMEDTGIIADPGDDYDMGAPGTGAYNKSDNDTAF